MGLENWRRNGEVVEHVAITDGDCSAPGLHDIVRHEIPEQPRNDLARRTEMASEPLLVIAEMHLLERHDGKLRLRGIPRE